MINRPGMKRSKMDLLLQNKPEGAKQKSQKFDDMMIQAYSIIDYQLDRESSKYHQSVIKKINDDNKDNRINIEEYSMKSQSAKPLSHPH
jgi:hypothetical protein